MAVAGSGRGLQLGATKRQLARARGAPAARTCSLGIFAAIAAFRSVIMVRTPAGRGRPGARGLRVWSRRRPLDRRRRRWRSKGGAGAGLPLPPHAGALGRFVCLAGPHVSVGGWSQRTMLPIPRRWHQPFLGPRRPPPRRNARTSQANHLLQLRAQRAALLQQPLGRAHIDCCFCAAQRRGRR